jgi:sugar phosphate isomerase/epimerase
LREGKEQTVQLTLGCTTRPYRDLPFADACQRIAAAGYTDVGVFSGVGSGSPRQEILAARQTATDVGLAPSLLLARARLELELDGAEAAYRSLIDGAAALGASWILDLGTAQEAFYERYLALMRRVASYAESAGVQITVKPHGGITRTTEDLIAVHRQVDHPAYGVCYDPGNIIYYTQGSERPETHLARVAPLVTACIIKDCVVRDGQPDVMITPGEGWVDFDQVLAGLTEARFRGPLYVECVGGESIAEIDRNVRRTRTYLEEILARLPE